MKNIAIGGCLTALLIFVFCAVGWCTHIIYCFQHHEWIRMIVLAILAPLGVIDGYGIIFHWW